MSTPDLSAPAVATLGDAQLDEDHAALHRLILSLRAAPLATAEQALSALHRHAADHFALEDEVLRANPNGNAKCHLDEHSAVLRTLQEVQLLLSQDEASPGAKANLLDRLTHQLLQWLPMHVSEMDAAVANERMQQRFGATAVRLIPRMATRHTAGDTHALPD